MAYRDNKEQKLITQNSRETRVKRDQTFSAQKGSIGKFGTFKSRQSPDDPRGMIRALYSSRQKRKITMPKMPWDDEEGS